MNDLTVNLISNGDIQRDGTIWFCTIQAHNDRRLQSRSVDDVFVGIFFFFAALKYIAKNEFLKNKKSRIARTSNKNTAHARPNTKKKKKPFVYLGLAVEKISTPVREHNELGIVFRPRQFPILKKQKNAHKRNYT